jgi:hypothetical protein
MNSTRFEKLHGFLKRKSTSHSLECRANRRVNPASNSSQFSMGVTSTAAVGPKLDAPSLRLQLGAPPSSRIAAGSLSISSPDALLEPKSKDDSSRDIQTPHFSGRKHRTEALIRLTNNELSPMNEHEQIVTHAAIGREMPGENVPQSSFRREFVLFLDRAWCGSYSR